MEALRGADLGWLGEKQLERIIAAGESGLSKLAETFGPLIEALKSGMADTKWQSFVSRDSRRAEEILSYLIGQLSGSERDARVGAARVLGVLGDSRAIGGLRGALKDRQSEVRFQAAGSLINLGERSEGLETLIALLKDRDARIRMLAAERLGWPRNAPAVQPLTERLSDAHSRVRCAAAVALGEIGDTRAIPALRARLQDREHRVRRLAQEALARLGSPSS
jgi:HEAT repeat protein